jgi:pyruvate dehydrogenase E1 component beta subunit
MRLSIAEALRKAIGEEMQRDETVFCIGEDIGVPGGFGGAFTVTLGLEKDFKDRIIDTPISEVGIFGAACGAAIMGMRPIADVQYGDFLLCAMDQIVNQIAKLRYMSGGNLKVPVVMRAPVGVTGRGSQHAQCLELNMPSVLSLILSPALV